MRPPFMRRARKPKPVIVDGVPFATKGEAERYASFRDQVSWLREICRDEERGTVLFEGTGPSGLWRESYHLTTKGRNKYRAVKVFFDGFWFDSKREATHYGRLKRRIEAGEITGLERQLPFRLTVSGQLVGHYIADFVYLDSRTGKRHVDDAKGMRTPLYQWKKKHVAFEHGVQIREV